ncbi:MAG: VCBS repeat-containing protein, partial [Caldilineaceae bacterium]|nr:VCBS repeat-containing protein [Caldilineaceae bacterium]
VDLGLGDLDNNGTLDVIAYNFGSPSALYANSGAGVFTRIQTFAAATDPADRLAVGDLDGDGDYDLVTAQKAGMTIVYMNNGQGALQQTRTLPAGLKPVLQDVDANGALDIVLIRPDSSQPNVSRIVPFLNNGAGVFTAAPLNLSGGKGFNNRFAIGDMDGDGDLDFVISSLAVSGCGQQGCENLRLLLNRGLLGYTAISLDSVGAEQIDLVDLDNDGDLDIAASGLAADTTLPNDLQDRIYLNQGINQLTASATFMIKEVGAAPAQPHPLAIADFNADGQLDIAVGGSGFATIYHGRNGQLFDACPINPLLLDAELAADINGDAYLDIVLRSGLILRNNGAGDFSPSISLPLVLSANSHLAAADVNGDGRLDLVAFYANAPAVILLQAANGQFSNFFSLDSQSFPATSLATGDVDGDGDIDLLVGVGTPAGSATPTPGQNRLYLNNGAGQFIPTTELDGAVSDTQAVALGDLDADGYLDLIVANSGEAANEQQGRQNYVYFNNGAGQFTATQALGSGADRTRSLAVGDVNGDGHLDIVAANYAQLNTVYVNDGNGGFAAFENVGQYLDRTARIHLVDIDHDRDLDMIAANETEADALFLNDGRGHFTASSAYEEPFSDARLFTIQTGDFDRDGDLELVTDVQSLSVTPYVADCIMAGRLTPSAQTADRMPK